jgi:hypothetical protein
LIFNYGLAFTFVFRFFSLSLKEFCMSLLKMKLKAAVLLGIAGVLVFAGGALAIEPSLNYKIVCNNNLTFRGVFGEQLSSVSVADSVKGKCVVISATRTESNKDTLWKWDATSSTWKSGTDASFNPGASAAWSWTLSTQYLDTTAEKSKAYELKFDADMSNVTAGSMTTSGSELTTLKASTVGNCVTNISVMSKPINNTNTPNVMAQKVHALYNWTVFNNWLGANGKTVKSGTQLADLNIPDIPTIRPATVFGLGVPRYRFVGTPTGASKSYDSVAVPVLPGTYDIWVSFGKGTNNDSTNIKGQTLNRDYVALTSDGKKFTVAYDTRASWVLESLGDTAVIFASNGKYSLKGPALFADFGSIDTIEYEAATSGGGGLSFNGEDYPEANDPTVGEIKGVTAKGAGFELSVGPDADNPVVTGAYLVTVKIRGKDPASATPRLNWEFDHTFKVAIAPKTLKTDDVTVLAGGSAYVYTASPIDGKVQVKDGNKVLTASLVDGASSLQNDYGVNRTLNASGAATTSLIEGYDAEECTDAGTAKVWVEGLGNYKGIVEKTFTIAKKTLTPRLATTNYCTDCDGTDDDIVKHLSPKPYDGSTVLDTVAFKVFDSDDKSANEDNPKGGLDVEFAGWIDTDEPLVNVDDYTFTATLNSAAVGSRTATVAVTLKAASDVAKNYTLTNSPFTFTVSGVTVAKRNPANDPSNTVTDSAYSETFKYTIPKNHYFFGSTVATRRGIGSVTYQNDGTNPGAKPIKVVYTYPGVDSNSDPVPADFIDAVTNEPFEGDSTRAPRFAGTYTVKVIVEDSSATNVAKHVTAGTYTLGSYTINEPGVPTIVTDLPAEVNNRTTRTKTLEIGATAHNYGTAANPVLGTLSYRWYRKTTNSAGDADSVQVQYGSSQKLDVTTTDSVNSVTYFVWIENASATFHSAINGLVRSGDCEVKPLPAPKSIVGQVVITKPDSVTYDGSFIEPNSANEQISVRFFESVSGTDTVWGGPSGDGYLTQQTVTDGEGDYRLTYSANKNVGTATVLVSGVNDFTGGVSVTFKIVKKKLTVLDLAFADKRPYTGEALGANVRPVVQGETGMGAITVTYNGQAAVPIEQGVYNLVASVAEGTNYTAASNLSLGAYEIGMGVLDSTCFSVETFERTVNDPNLSKGVGNVTFVKGTGFGDSVFITYDGLTDVPTDSGSYAVSARILGGVNYAAGTVSLGTYKVKSAVSIASANRVVPTKPATEVAAIAPVKVVASGFTAGPSPVRNGEVIKFFSKSNVKSGSLYIFDQSGNSVAKVKASGSGEIGKWKVSNASAGSYVVKGVLIGKDGTKEKVSFVFAVVK